MRPSAVPRKRAAPAWPCSPSLGRKRPRWARHGGLGPATALRLIWVCSCCAAISARGFRTIFGKSVAGWQLGFAKWQRLSFGDIQELNAFRA